jgi:F0F1-type ATP synthase membrane subunit c/vacuolar-type H+-ATPase subunit K
VKRSRPPTNTTRSMAEMAQGLRLSRMRWVWAGAAALLAFLTVGYALAILLVSGYSAAVDTPRSPGGVAIVVALVPVPFIVGLRSCRGGRRRGLAGDALVRRVSLILFAVGIALLIALGLLAGPI